MNIDEIKEEALAAKADNRKFFQRLRKKKTSYLDNVVHRIHQQVFEEINCLECANCCKTTSPIFYKGDIERMARALKMKYSEFIDEYLHQDDEGDYVLNEAPCPFLADDNTCIVYESRPTACREYPHTNRKRFYQILNLTLKNTEICPAVFEIVKKMKDEKDLI
ncbi:YkgJ family cysteine cluster protein [Xanthovirga aplysinae]|uniref:YkgJ family cysteine cluster protein n=1 Tax=Xanthovirga aplysinae TaxID=2529853 RepID=UPI0012BC39A6|nr:YkgJ family cysteine cluster protein [Xanthovirga aplysinae]MTI30794.1 YkgJ family cysteine cluster protein [Xanthovirga aplysinae]